MSKNTKRPCSDNGVTDVPDCLASNSEKSDLSVAATATRIGNEWTIKAVVRNHQWVNSSASGFELTVSDLDSRKRKLETRTAKLPESKTPISCRDFRCEFLTSVAPGEEVTVEMTVHTSFTYDLKLAVHTLDTASGYHLELHDEDNMVIIPVPT